MCLNSPCRQRRNPWKEVAEGRERQDGGARPEGCHKPNSTRAQSPASLSSGHQRTQSLSDKAGGLLTWSLRSGVGVPPNILISFQAPKMEVTFYMIFKS